MEFAGTFGTGKEKGARNVGFGRLGAAGKRGLKSSCLINNRKWYGKSRRDQLSSPLSELCDACVSSQAVGEWVRSQCG